MLKKITKRIFNALGYDIISRKATEANLNKENIKYGHDTTFENCSVEIRCDKRDKMFLEIGSDCMISGHYVFENENGKINIGNRTFIGNSTFISINKIDIGNDVLISWGCTFIDNDAHSLIANERKFDVADWKKGTFQQKTGLYKNWEKVNSAPIKINNQSWIGFNSIILKGVTIGEGAVVGAGSVVTRDVPAWVIAAGNPARIIREIPPEER